MMEWRILPFGDSGQQSQQGPFSAKTCKSSTCLWLLGFLLSSPLRAHVDTEVLKRLNVDELSALVVIRPLGFFTLWNSSFKRRAVVLLLLMVFSSNASHFPRPFDLSSAAGPSTTVLVKLLGCFLFSPCNDSFRSADGAPFLSRKGGKPVFPFCSFSGEFMLVPCRCGATRNRLSTHNWRGTTRSQLQA